MKKIHILAISVLSLAFLSGCESYLDRQPDDQLTADNVFEKYATTQQYLISCYYYMPNLSYSVAYYIESAAADETAVAYEGGRPFAAWLHGNLTPAYQNTNYRWICYWNMYCGIRECTYFMQNVGRCPEITADEMKTWKAEARFLRAYYYYRLLLLNGPVVLLKDELVDFNRDDIDMADRSPWDTIVDWVCDELDLAAKDLSADPGDYYLGRASKGAALALKAKMLLYSARPLFNGQNGTHIYDNMKNSKGEKLFCTEYDPAKWQRAAKACKDVINLGIYALENDKSVDPIVNYHNIFFKMKTSETIFCRVCDGSGGNVVQNSMPSAIGLTNSYGGVSITQKMVDYFPMANGYWPITNMESESYNNGVGDIQIDPRAEYTEKGSTMFVNKFWELVPSMTKLTTPVPTMNMFVGRDPRFYANVIWSGQPYVTKTLVTNIQYYYGGAHGAGVYQGYPPTGYQPMKFARPDMDPNTKDYGYVAYPMIRYADILLAYVECLNEYDPANPDILKYWNQIRDRAGIPGIGNTEGTVYPEVVGNQDLQRKYIRRERAVELCFETQRYYDITSWMTATRENNGEVGGCDITQTTDAVGSAFWKRTSIFDCYGEGGIKTRRIFQDKHYLLPMQQIEMDRLPNYTQNYGW